MVITPQWLDDKAYWARQTFGPGYRVDGILDHISKEMEEIRLDPTDLMEWVDILQLAFDGAARQGYSGREVIRALQEKQAINEERNWPDWRTAPEGKAIEHVRDSQP